MAIEGHKEEVVLGDTSKEVLVVSISNGALEQLELLKKFLGTDDPVEVIKTGIAFVQKIKEQGEKQEKDSESKNQ